MLKKFQNDTELLLRTGGAVCIIIGLIGIVFGLRLGSGKLFAVAGLAVLVGYILAVIYECR